LRNEAGQIVVDETGMPQAGEKVIGTVSPDSARIQYICRSTQVKLSAVLEWKCGGQMYSGTRGLLDYYGVSQHSADFRKMDSFLFELPAVKVTGTDSNASHYAPNDIQISGAMPKPISTS
jgi:hypothetical protein